jgi:hypothetical protein
MKELTEGHTFVLDSMEGKNPQRLEFIHKGMDGETGAFVTINDGTTNEEVLRCLIKRIQYLNAKAGCRENSIAITKLEEALMWLEKRTADRLSRGVEGTASK